MWLLSNKFITRFIIVDYKFQIIEFFRWWLTASFTKNYARWKNLLLTEFWYRLFLRNKMNRFLYTVQKALRQISQINFWPIFLKYFVFLKFFFRIYMFEAFFYQCFYFNLVKADFVRNSNKFSYNKFFLYNCWQIYPCKIQLILALNKLKKIFKLLQFFLWRQYFTNMSNVFVSTDWIFSFHFSIEKFPSAAITLVESEQIDRDLPYEK